MALDSTQIRLAPTGHVYVAPLGSTLPTDATTTLDTAFKELGYLSDDGVSLTPGVDTQGIKAWQSAVDVKTTLTGVSLNVKFQMLQVTQQGTAEYFFGQAWANSGGIGKLVLPSNPTLAERCLDIDWTDDKGYANRIVFGRGTLTDRDAMQLQRTAATALGVTFQALDLNGTLATFYSNNPDLIPAT